MNLYNWIFDKPELDNIALVDDGQEIKYKDLIKLINSVSHNIPLESEVIYIYENKSINIIIDLLAVLKLHKKAIIISSTWLEDERNLRKGYSQSVILSNRKISKIITQSDEMSNNLTSINLLTSGTTGIPKICSLKEDVVIKKVSHLSQIFLSSTDTFIEALVYPASSVTALIVQIIPTLRNNGTLIIVNDLAKLENCLNTYSVNFIGMTPTLFNLISEKNLEIFSRVGCVFLGGEPIDFKKVKIIAKKLINTNIIIGYGLTEGTGMVSYGNILRIPEESVGKIIEIENIQIENDLKIGEIQIRNTVNDEWINTGDIGYIKNGYLYIVDRIKNIVIVSGNNIFPNIVKQKILSIDGVIDLIVYGIPNEITGEAIAIDVMTTLDYSELMNNMRMKLNAHEFPKKVNFVDSLKISSSGKRVNNNVEKTK